MIDSHCHLAGAEFAADLDEVAARARQAGVAGAVCILAAGDEAEDARAGQVASVWPEVRFAAGVHPHQSGEWAGGVDRAVAAVRRAVEQRRACAIGEIGLDYHYDFSPRATQREVFEAQVDLAREMRLPVIIHTREATDDTFAVLRDGSRGDVRGVFHCFTGDLAMARRALDTGFHVSFAGILTFPKAAGLREVAAFVPSGSLLAETDSPYLAPVPHRGKRNEPAHVAEVYETLARIRGVARTALADEIASNFMTLFGGASR